MTREMPRLPIKGGFSEMTNGMNDVNDAYGLL